MKDVQIVVLKERETKFMKFLNDNQFDLQDLDYSKTIRKDFLIYCFRNPSDSLKNLIMRFNFDFLN